ncbi:ABC transporter permease [Candidatus Uhrbacteria bacterium]|nr:ABC transporter permease [Candidatus Uhrbacteria bacterium]
MNWVGLYTLVRRDIERVFRVATQSLVSPWVSALLYIFIFGFVIGKSIDLIAGVSYLEFVLPGILMMNIITAGFSHTSFGIYFQRFARNIEEVLVSPLSYFEMLVGHVVAAVVRALLVGLGIYVIALLFGAAAIVHPFWLVFYIVSVATIFALIGIIVGLWAKGFEHLNVLNTYVIMPLSFLGGVFYSVEMLPDKLKFITFSNPLFYFIDGLRYSMIGISESNRSIGLILIIGMILVLGGIVWRIFKTGWRIRN